MRGDEKTSSTSFIQKNKLLRIHFSASSATAPIFVPLCSSWLEDSAKRHFASEGNFDRKLSKCFSDGESIRLPLEAGMNNEKMAGGKMSHVKSFCAELLCRRGRRPEGARVADRRRHNYHNERVNIIIDASAANPNKPFLSLVSPFVCFPTAVFETAFAPRAQLRRQARHPALAPHQTPPRCVASRVSR